MYERDALPARAPDARPHRSGGHLTYVQTDVTTEPSDRDTQISLSSGVVFLCGATCSGKTELALQLARRFDAEIIGADSRQIYRGMPIGTAAPTPQQRTLVPHHLVEFLDPHERYSAGRFAADALTAIDSIALRGKRAIVVGGTGFYLRALAGDVALSRAYDRVLRARIAREQRVHPPEVLHAWLAARAPQRAAAIAANDRYRVARALEIAFAQPQARRGDVPEDASLRARGIRTLKIALEVTGTLLEKRIAARVDAMLETGLVEEAERIGPDAVAADAVGYPQAHAFLAGWLTEAELRAALIRATRRYAKRQVTWLRSEPAVRWVQPQAVSASVRAELGWS